MCMLHMKFLSLMVLKLWPRITCDTNRAIFRIKVTVKVIYPRVMSQCFIGWVRVPNMKSLCHMIQTLWTRSNVLPRHTDMIITRCPEFHSDTQKHYICVDRNTSKKSNHYIIYFIVKGKTYIKNGNLVSAMLHYTDKTYNWPFCQEIWK